METATAEMSQVEVSLNLKKESELGIDVNQAGDGSTAEIVKTPVDAAPAGASELLDHREPDNMGSSQSQPAVAMTRIKPLAGGDNGHVASGQAKKDIDDLFPAESLTTCALDGKVRLRMSSSGPGADKPYTFQTMFRNTLERFPNTVAVGVKREQRWVKWTYTEYHSAVQTAAKGFIKLGLEPYHGVGILGFNSPEWLFSYFGAIFSGGKAVGIYTTNSAEACEYVLGDCQANLIVVENHAQLQKILKVWPNLPHLKAIVQYTGEVAERRDNIYSWDELMRLGAEVEDAALQERSMLQAPNTCASLIYTSGTTGNPKAVMISHDNCTWMCKYIHNAIKAEFGKEVYVSFLPLSHIAAQLLDIICTLYAGSTVYFAQPDALKGSLGDTWKECRPTGALAVPRVWEKLQEKMVTAGASAPKIRKKLIAWAKDKGGKGIQADATGTSKPWGWSLANLLVFKKVRGLLGLDRCKVFGSAAAPIMKETLQFFADLNIRLDEVYGMSECSGPHTFCTEDAYRMTSVGKEVADVQTQLDNPDSDGNGEILMWGRHVFMGYLNEPAKTEETIDSRGWLHSGDIGKKDEDGFLYITGRIKEIIITAGGENIAPVPVEDHVKEALPCVSNCMLIGDKRKFLSMLITLKTEVNLDTMEPQDTLTADCQAWCQARGSQAKTVADALADNNVLKGIQEGIDKANKKAVSRAANVQKWSLLPRDFSLPGGELGPTLKLRRPIVMKMYEKTISGFYEG